MQPGKLCTRAMSHLAQAQQQARLHTRKVPAKKLSRPRSLGHWPEASTDHGRPYSDDGRLTGLDWTGLTGTQYKTHATYPLWLCKACVEKSGKWTQSWRVFCLGGRVARGKRAVAEASSALLVLVRLTNPQTLLV